MIPLSMLLPPAKQYRSDPVAPLGISFNSEPSSCMHVVDLDYEVARMKTYIQSHPLIGSVITVPPAQSVQSGSPNISATAVPPVAPRPRRSSVGGSRAQEIATQYETDDASDSEVVEPMGDYPITDGVNSEVEYFETMSETAVIDLPESSRTVTPARRPQPLPH
jgi:hypothetical protein